MTKGRQLESKWQLSKVEKVHSKAPRALDVVEKSLLEVQALSDELKEASEGRQKAEWEAAGFKVEVEALSKARDDVQHRLGLAETQVRTLTSTLRAAFTAQEGV